MSRKNKRDMRIKTFMLFAITLLIWALLFVVKLHFWGADGESIIDDIVSNMIGIIPPLLIFDFGLEYLTRDNIANDISEKNHPDPSGRIRGDWRIQGRRQNSLCQEHRPAPRRR